MQNALDFAIALSEFRYFSIFRTDDNRHYGTISSLYVVSHKLTGRVREGERGWAREEPTAKRIVKMEAMED